MPDLTPELLCDLWQPDGLSLSPDGGRVAWSAGPAGHRGATPESAVWVADVGTPGSARRWTRGQRDRSPAWSADGSRLAFLSSRGDSGKAGVHVLHTDGGEAYPVAVRERDIADLAWSPDGARIAFLAPADPDDEDERREQDRDDADVRGERRHPHRLYVVDATEPRPADHDAATPEPLAAGDRHVAALAWSPDGDRIAITTWPTPELDDSNRAEIAVVDLGTREPRVVTAAHSPRELTWTRDGRHLAWLSTVDQASQGSSTLWTAEADGDGARVAGPGADGDRCVLGLARGRGRTDVLATVVHGLRAALVPIDLSTGEWSEPVADVVGSFGHAQVTASGTLAAIQHSDGLHGRVVAGDARGLTVHSAHHDVLADVDLPVVEALHATAADGTELDAVLIRSQEVAAGGPAKTLVLPHGGPYGRSSIEWETHPVRPAQLLASRGYAVLLPNYRGGAGRGHGFAAAARSDMGGDEWGDVLTLLDAAVDRGIADPDRLGLGGWSQGGFLTAWGVTHSDRFKAGVIGAGPPTGTRWR